MVNNLNDSSYKEFITQLEMAIGRRFEKELADDITAFTRNYLASVHLAELLVKPIDDIYGDVVSTWQFVQQFNRIAAKVRIYNPNVETDGWQNPHTVMEILVADTPFVVDSVRLALNSHHITIHSIINQVFVVERNAQYKLEKQSLLDSNQSQKSQHEALLHIEIDRESNAKKRSALEDEIVSILAELDVLVSDFPTILEKVDTVKDELKMLKPPALKKQAGPVVELLNWLVDSNFTFLGYREYSIENDAKAFKYLPQFDSDLGVLRTNSSVDFVDDDRTHEILKNNLLVFAKSSTRSRIYRPAYPELVIINKYDEKGRVIGDHRFLGLFTSRVFNEDPLTIPVVKDKVGEIVSNTAFDSNSHDAKQLQRIISVYPRGELFQITAKELYDISIGILHIRERPKVKLFVRTDVFGRFVTCIIYAPRENYSTEMRKKFQSILCHVFEALDINFNTNFSESILVRVCIVLKVSPEKPIKFDLDDVHRRLVKVCRSWDDEFHHALNDTLGEEKGALAAASYSNGLSNSYKEDFLPRIAVSDVLHIDKVGEVHPLELSFYHAVEDPEGTFRFKLFHLGHLIPLSDVIPVLENLGLRILGERPYEVKRKHKEIVWIHDFSVCYSESMNISLGQVKESFQSAFVQIWGGAVESDGFNRLVLGAKLIWQEITILRAYAKYLKQVGFPFSQLYMEEALVRNPLITSQLVHLFKTRFDPLEQSEGDSVQEAKVVNTLQLELDKVENLDEDRILRRIMDVMMGTIRTNYFQWCDAPGASPCLVLKFNPSLIPDLPLPLPMYEIFVYSARVEGVHLRAGKVARGGLRWSDRMEDFRTEVLGLVKAQQVKNSVIVPVGAKGGFVCKKLPLNAGRTKIMEEVVSCYRLFISSLLDVTDNLKQGLIIPPEKVVRKDTDDPYLVVAADKGTATFSDIANQIAEEYGFWMGDAFASGGSVGYDHKKMGITARGAWVSVQRHFREVGINVQKQAFTVVGIGDMSGDVFGNGMLLSKKIKLIAAFNHLDIFIDPSPVPEKSFSERQRLFELPNSTWQDYNAELISKGGGVFSRRAKSISITPEMAKAFSISEKKLTPNDLISTLLKASVDLIWNGGVGTYIKSSAEQHTDVGDKSNDSLRINGDEVHCKVFAEGGNLGVTQLARIEMAIQGVSINADFIDNAAGVDCSDHEVNIKILLNEIVSRSDLTQKHRNELLAEMTSEVSRLVLDNNYRQVLAISIAESQSAKRLDELKRYINYLEDIGKLNRSLEFLPSNDEINERKKSGLGLVRPELSVLLSYSKGLLKEQLVDTNLLDDARVVAQIELAFPKVITTKFKHSVYDHYLKKEIVATQLANAIVNDMGLTFIMRMHDASGAEPEDIAKAYLISRGIYELDELWQEIEGLDYKVSNEVQINMMNEISRVVRRSTRWFLRNRRTEMDVESMLSHFKPKILAIRSELPNLLNGELKASYDGKVKELIEGGVPEKLASKVACTTSMLSFLGVVEASTLTDRPLTDVATLYFMIGDELGLHWFGEQINALHINNHWQALAREAYRDDLDWQQRALTIAVLQTEAPSDITLEERLVQWRKCYQALLNRWDSMITEIKLGNTQEFSMYAVALRELLDLAQSSSHACPISD